MSEAAIDRLRNDYLSFILVDQYQPNSPFAPDDVDWDAFMRDLEQFPEIAFHEDGLSEFPPLFYVILVPDVPVKVVKTLLEINPKAVMDIEADHAWNIFQWMQWDKIYDISPEILRLLLPEAPNLVCEENLCENETPLEFFLNASRGQLSEQVLAILELSRDACAMALANHFSGTFTLSPRVLKCALKNAEKFGRDGEDIFGKLFKDRRRNTYKFVLGKKIFEHLDRKKLRLFHRYLAAFVKGRLNSGNVDLNFTFDTTSLTCCVLFLLATLEKDDEEDYEGDDPPNVELEMWKKYVEISGKNLTKVNKKGTIPLYCAIRLGHQMSPVIDDLLKEDPLVLESLDASLKLPPFVVAATVPMPDFFANYLLGEYYQHNMEINTVNTTFSLLRANPSMITLLKPSVKKSAKVDTNLKRVAADTIEDRKLTGSKKKLRI